MTPRRSPLLLLLSAAIVASLASCTGKPDGNANPAEPANKANGTASGQPKTNPQAAAGAAKVAAQTVYEPGDARAALLEKLKPAAGQSKLLPLPKKKTNPSSPVSPSVIPRVGEEKRLGDDVDALADLPPRILTEKEAKLVAEAETLALLLSEALKSGNNELIEQCFVSKEDLEGIVLPGMLTVLSGMAYTGSKEKLAALVEALEGQQAKMSWDPGRLRDTPDRKNIWAKKSPMLIAAVLTLEVEGAPILVQLDQVLYGNAGWKILRLR